MFGLFNTDDEPEDDFSESNEGFQEEYGISADALSKAPSAAVMMLAMSSLMLNSEYISDEPIGRELRRRAIDEINKTNSQ